MGLFYLPNDVRPLGFEPVGLGSGSAQALYIVGMLFDNVGNLVATDKEFGLQFLQDHYHVALFVDGEVIVIARGEQLHFLIVVRQFNNLFCFLKQLRSDRGGDGFKFVLAPHNEI